MEVLQGLLVFRGRYADDILQVLEFSGYLCEGLYDGL
jgi:hypothetical protein